MVSAVIFAGGVGARMKSQDIPKQFLIVDGKPIIIRTLEVFSEHPEVDEIVVACLESWIPVLESRWQSLGSKRSGRSCREAQMDMVPFTMAS